MLHAMDDTINELKNTGLKATLPRLKILEIFQNSQQRHMTAEDVFRLLVAEHSDIGLATVYRVLTQFEQAACSAAAISRPARRCTSSTRAAPRPPGVPGLRAGRGVLRRPDRAAPERHRARARLHAADHALSLYAHCDKAVCAYRGSAPPRRGA
jgi:Fur family ferric uptake transcriptional regulator